MANHRITLFLTCIGLCSQSTCAWSGPFFAGNPLASAIAPLIIASAVNFDQNLEQHDVTFRDHATFSLLLSQSSRRSPTEDYLPRRLYPGTYKNYCGPTPETSVSDGCIAHGWYSDAPADRVDAACEQHDVAYCNCETELLSRRTFLRHNLEPGSDESRKPIPMLSAMVALRFATQPILNNYIGVDKDYMECIHKADQQLLATGIMIRGQQQQSSCSTDPSLSWFCDLSGKGTLAAFEKVNLNLFLRDLDFEDASTRPSPNLCPSPRAQTNRQPSMQDLENKRSKDLRNAIDAGQTLRQAASSSSVIEDEKQMLERLTLGY